jgi:uncharacterized protein (DUF697 family)
MTTTLARSRDYLSGQRRSIIARALLGSLAGALPIPFLDELAVERVVGDAYRRIADAHHVDLDDAAMKVLVHGATTQPSVVDTAANTVVYKLVSTVGRRMMIAVASVRRARTAARSFVAMTLFDHYCARLHTGLALDKPLALALRDEINRVIDHTPGALAFHPFRRGLIAGAKAVLRAPLQLANFATGGALRKRLGAPKDIETGEVVEPVELDQLADKRGFLARAVTSVELQLSSEANPFLDAAIDSLDRRWRARVAAGTVPRA